MPKLYENVTTKLIKITQLKACGTEKSQMFPHSVRSRVKGIPGNPGKLALIHRFQALTPF